MAEQNDLTQRKVQKFKYEASALKNCRDTAIMMGEKMVKQNAEEKFGIQRWLKHDKAVQDAGGHMTREILNKFYPGCEEDENLTRDQNQYLLLTNYID